MLSATEATIKELEARIKRLESVIQMPGPLHSAPPMVTLKCNGMMKIDAALLILPGGNLPIARAGDIYGTLTNSNPPIVQSEAIRGGNPQVLG